MMLAKFIGQDGSMGFRRGRVYNLEVAGGRGRRPPVIVWPVRCPYGSWDAFYANWQKVDTSDYY